MSALGMVMRTLQRIVDVYEGGKVAKNALAWITIHSDESGYSWPSQARLAKATGFTERAIRKALAELEAQGFITRRARFRRDGTRDSDGIQLCLERLHPHRDDSQRNAVPVEKPASTGTPRPIHRNPTAPPPEPDSGLVTLERTRDGPMNIPNLPVRPRRLGRARDSEKTCSIVARESWRGSPAGWSRVAGP